MIHIAVLVHSERKEEAKEKRTALSFMPEIELDIQLSIIAQMRGALDIAEAHIKATIIKSNKP